MRCEAVLACGLFCFAPMTLPDLARLAAAGEGLTIEFKKRVPSPEKLAREVIAFANTQGGRLLVGVDDDGTLAGLKDAIEEEYALREAIARHCDPPVPFGTERVMLASRREVLVVRVPASTARPHVLVGVERSAAGEAPPAFVRVGASSVVWDFEVANTAGEVAAFGSMTTVRVDHEGRPVVISAFDRTQLTQAE